jgi:hypothetical protein
MYRTYRRYSNQLRNWEVNSRKIMHLQKNFLLATKLVPYADSTFCRQLQVSRTTATVKFFFLQIRIFFCQECESKLLGVWSLLEQTRQDYIK